MTMFREENIQGHCEKGGAGVFCKELMAKDAGVGKTTQNKLHGNHVTCVFGRK